jgi:hypothetical protein
LALPTDAFATTINGKTTPLPKNRPADGKSVLTIPGGHLDCVALDGVVAQLVERLNGIQEVRGSNPLGSTILRKFKPPFSRLRKPDKNLRR